MTRLLFATAVTLATFVSTLSAFGVSKPKVPKRMAALDRNADASVSASEPEIAKPYLRDRGNPAYSSFSVLPFVGAGGYIWTSYFAGVKGAFNIVPGGFIPVLNSSFLVDVGFKRVYMKNYYLFLDEELTGSELFGGVRMEFHLAKWASVGLGTGLGVVFYDEQKYDQRHSEFAINIPLSGTAHFTENFSLRADLDLSRRSILIGPMFRM